MVWQKSFHLGLCSFSEKWQEILKPNFALLFLIPNYANVRNKSCLCLKTAMLDYRVFNTTTEIFLQLTVFAMICIMTTSRLVKPTWAKRYLRNR